MIAAMVATIRTRVHTGNTSAMFINPPVPQKETHVLQCFTIPQYVLHAHALRYYFMINAAKLFTCTHSMMSFIISCIVDKWTQIHVST